MTKRARPVAHFTPRRGWINDPYGVRWDGRRYHMYYQSVLDQTRWSPACRWGHAVSADLVSWEERPLALVPGRYELGCWSGCVVEDSAGAVRAFYTRVGPDDLDLGIIAVARCAPSGRLESGVGDVVIGGPPDGIGVTAFRDPFVWRDPAGWKMVVGAGTGDGAGAVLQYRSRELERWEYSGVLCEGRIPIDPGATRQVWECPQMVQIDGIWVLIVSVQIDGRAGHVMAAAGSYDGGRFTGGQWRRLAFGSAPYAASVFRDRSSRPSMICWLQEDSEHQVDGCGWAGAESLVSEVAIDSAGQVIATPHLALSRSRVFARPEPGISPWAWDLSELARGQATHLTVGAGRRVDIEIRSSGRRRARVARSARRQGLVIDRPGRATDVIPIPTDDTVELFVDADILEIFGGGLYGAWRLPIPGKHRPSTR